MGHSGLTTPSSAFLPRHSSWAISSGSAVSRSGIFASSCSGSSRTAKGFGLTRSSWVIPLAQRLSSSPPLPLSLLVPDPAFLLYDWPIKESRKDGLLLATYRTLSDVRLPLVCLSWRIRRMTIGIAVVMTQPLSLLVEERLNKKWLNEPDPQSYLDALLALIFAALFRLKWRFWTQIHESFHSNLL